ncbi:MAG: heavy metal-associated domain-containing protein [Eubacteriales bacterium]|nr:heavy metal-associated domain-containing protein [Eubacteriales bacterium]
MKKTYKIIVDGMSCGHCTAAVKEALSVYGDVIVDLETKTATVTTDAAIDANEVKGKIEDIGFDFVSMSD